MIDKTEIKNFIMSECKKEGWLTTWWISTFYENFCNFFNLDFDDIKINSNKIRYYLNKLEKEGLLDSNIKGTGCCGQTDFGMKHNKIWFIRENKNIEELEKEKKNK